jgi:type II secretory pathway pseudopilin PulG
MTRKSGVTIVELVFVAAIFILVITLLAPFVQLAKDRGRRVECEQNLRAISLGLKAYAADHAGAFPDQLKDLYPRYITEQAAFNCPSSKAAGVPENPDYKYIAGSTALSSAKNVVVEDADGNHGRYHRHVLRVDGSVDWVRQ